MKRIIIKSAFLVVPMLFIGCFTSEDNSGSGGSTISVNSDPSSISLSRDSKGTYVIDGSEIVTTTPEAYCNGEGVIESDKYTQTRNFVIVDGVLSMWGEYDCEAATYTGGGSELEGGIWTRTGQDDIPEGFDASPYCDGENDLPSGVNEVKSFNGGKETTQFTGTYCYAENLAEGEENVTNKGCDTYETTYGENEVVTTVLQSLNLETNAKVEISTFNGKSCEFNTPGYNDVDVTEAQCTEAYAAFTSSEDYSEVEDFEYYEWNVEYKLRREARANFVNCLEENDFPESMLYDY